ncbi:unnamed protein product, partial [Protopolystoma xenopodis]
SIIEPGSTVLGANKAGWTLHSALHAARSDVNCIIHIHLPDVIAVSCIRAGLLPSSPEATELLNEYGVRYHNYYGILVDESERESIKKDLGSSAKVLFLRNHGVAIAAASIPEAWYLVKRVVAACQTQMRLLQLGSGATLMHELQSSWNSRHNDPSRPFGDLVNNHHAGDCANNLDTLGTSASYKQNDETENVEPVWSPGELEFEAQMRLLDSAGYRTGHIYRQPNLLRRAPTGMAWPPSAQGLPADLSPGVLADFVQQPGSMSTPMPTMLSDIEVANAAGVQQKAKWALFSCAYRLHLFSAGI